jgi:maleylacetoacetate isomerase/maleylpyruvate isomerase
MQLYSYFRSGAAYRVRIALGLKNVRYEQVPIHLVREEHRGEAYAAVNPQRRVPALKLDDGTVLIQSLAIIDYLDETYPEPPFLPAGAALRARVRAVAHIVAMDIHPLGNSGPRNYLTRNLKLDEAAAKAWTAHWIAEGFAGIEPLLGDGPYAFGMAPTLADICLVPQVYTARRFGVDLTPFPRIVAADATASRHPAFAAAAPERQPDAE